MLFCKFWSAFQRICSKVCFWFQIKRLLDIQYYCLILLCYCITKFPAILSKLIRLSSYSWELVALKLSLIWLCLGFILLHFYWLYNFFVILRYSATIGYPNLSQFLTWRRLFLLLLWKNYCVSNLIRLSQTFNIVVFCCYKLII